MWLQRSIDFPIEIQNRKIDPDLAGGVQSGNPSTNAMWAVNAAHFLSIQSVAKHLLQRNRLGFIIARDRLPPDGFGFAGRDDLTQNR
jgi:hypothetical protein